MTVPIPCVCLSDLDGVVLEANASALALLELDAADVPGVRVARLLGPAAGERCEDTARMLDAGEAVVFTHLPIETAKGRAAWIDAHVRGVFEGGRRVGVEVFAIDVTARVEDERARRSRLESEVDAQREVLRQIVDDQDDLVYRARADGTLTFANRAYAEHVGVPASELVGRDVFELVPPRLHPVFRGQIAALTAERPAVRAAPIETRGGRVLEWIVRGFFSAEGRLVELQCMGHDVTALHAALEQREVLLREVHHRVKNNLQVISSLLAVQFEGFADPAVREGIQKTETRIRTLSLAHEALHRSPNVSRVDVTAYVGTLLDTLRGVFGARGGPIAIVHAVEPVDMDLDTAMRVGSIINELVSNSLKHAFDARGGTIRVELAQRGANIRLVVADDGKGLPERALDAPIRTLGLELVRQLCAHLGAALSVDRAAGTRFEIDFPPPSAE